MILSYAFFFTWGVDLFRGVLLGSRTILGFDAELMLLFIMSLGYFGMGILSYRVLKVRMRRRGIQGF